MAGRAVGAVVHGIAPLQTANPGAYALVGMGTLFAGIIRAPMTSVFMIFEITQDYQILVPLMVANLLSLLISRRFQPTSIYHALLEQDRVHLPSPSTRFALATWTAADVMAPDLPLVSADASIQAAWDVSRQDGRLALLVGEPSRLIGIVHREQLARAVESGRRSEPVTALVDGNLLHVHPDHASDVVLQRLVASNGVLPVVSREDVNQVVGLVTFERVLRFTRQARAPESTLRLVRLSCDSRTRPDHLSHLPGGAPSSHNPVGRTVNACM
jgi:CIC family chloride channel protein